MQLQRRHPLQLLDRIRQVQDKALFRIAVCREQSDDATRRGDGLLRGDGDGRKRGRGSVKDKDKRIGMEKDSNDKDRGREETCVAELYEKNVVGK